MQSASNGSGVATVMSYLPSVTDNKTINDPRSRENASNSYKDHSLEGNQGLTRVSPLANYKDPKLNSQYQSYHNLQPSSLPHGGEHKIDQRIHLKHRKDLLLEDPNVFDAEQFEDFKLGGIPGKIPELSSAEDRSHPNIQQQLLMRRNVRNVQPYMVGYTSNTTDELESQV